MQAVKTLVRVSGLAGPLCNIEANPSWTIWEVKLAVEAATGIPPKEQRLLSEDIELREAEVLSLFCPCEVEDLTLVRRAAEEVESLAKSGRRRTAALKLAPEAIRGNREVMLAAVRQHGHALEYATSDLRADREVVMAAVRQVGWALMHAAEEFRSDVDVVRAAVKVSGGALRFVADELKENPEIVFEAVQSDGLALQYAPEWLRADREIVTAAVRQTGRALEFAADGLQVDPFLACASRRRPANRRGSRAAALRSGLLYRVVAEGVPRRKIISRSEPDTEAKMCDIFPAGAEVVAAGPPEPSGWLLLNSMQLDGPLATGGTEWVLLDGTMLGYGTLLEQVPWAAPELQSKALSDEDVSALLAMLG